MELWIRSQDKKNLVKIINQIGLNYANNNMIIANFQPDFIGSQGEYYEKLGVYKTKERALEVLDEIQNILNPMLIFKNCECTKDVLDSIKEVGACIVHDNAKLEQINICVFEMPEV